MKKSLIILALLIAFIPFKTEGRSSKIIGIKARTRTVSSTQTLAPAHLAGTVKVDTSSGVVTLTLPNPSSALSGRRPRFVRDGGSGVTLQITSGSIDMAGASGTLLSNHPTGESGSSVELEYSGNSIFVLNPQGTWSLQ